MKKKPQWSIAVACVIAAGLTAAPVHAQETLSLNVVGGPMFAPGDPVTVTLDVANLSVAINAVQVFLNYDNTVLTLVDVVPTPGIGGVGWTEGVEADVAGDVDWVASLNGGSTTAPHTIATLNFTAAATGSTDVVFRAVAPPIFTKLTDVGNNTIFPALTNSAVVTVAGTGMAPRVSGLAVFYADTNLRACVGGDNPGAPCSLDSQCGGTPPTPAGTCSGPEQADPTITCLAAGSTANIGNITYYMRGITGIRVTFDRVVQFATVPADAFSYEWTTGFSPSPVFSPVTDAATQIAVTAADVGGVTVATIRLTDNHVRKQWLKVTLDAAQVSGSGVPLDGEMTGNPVVLPSGDGTFGGDAVFYVGNMAGDVDGDRVVRLGDAVLAREQANPFLPVLIDNVFDVDKDGVVRLGDAVLIREESNPFLGLPLISP